MPRPRRRIHRHIAVEPPSETAADSRDYRRRFTFPASRGWQSRGALDPLDQGGTGEAQARVARLSVADLDREIRYADGALWSIRDLLWRKLLLHGVHHRGQLVLLCRLAGGMPPGLFGRTREGARAQLAAATGTT